jgi:Leucine-rich repeat (LRR) protein
MTQEKIDEIVKKVIEDRLEQISIVDYDKELPNEIFECTWLKKLYLYDCPKLDITSCLKLKNLNELHVRFCNVNSFDGSHIFTKMKELNLEGNNLSRLPNKLPKSIISLDISDNKLVSINEVESLPNLIELLLINNEIQEVPNFLKNPKLELIELGNNNILRFPKSLVKLNHERMKARKFDIHIYGNPFIKTMNLNPEDYILRNEWGYADGVSNSEHLLRDILPILNDLSY